jgi:hypothetical protein
MPIPGTFDDPKKKLTDDPGVTSPPNISAVSSGVPSGGSVTITWTTDKATSSRVEYGIAPNRTQLSTNENITQLVTGHSVTIGNLVVGALYLFRVHSRLGGGKDGGNNVVIDGYDFTADGQFVAA